MPRPHAIILLRHAEKPDADAGVGGVDEQGRADEQSLSVRGWQRAGALVPWLVAGLPAHRIGAPDILVAAASSTAHPSRRPVQTLRPLADRLGLGIDDRLRSDAVDAAAGAIAAMHGTVVVSWRHEPLPALARALAQQLGMASAGIPGDWPAACFDQAWVFSRGAAAGLRFVVVQQRLLSGDAGAN